MIVGNIKHLDKIIENEEPIQSTNIVKSNFIDNEIFEETIKDTNKIKNKIEEQSVETPIFKQLSKDLFNSLYKIRPEVYSKENLYKSLHMGHDIFTQITNDEKFEELRRNTCGDIFNSTLFLDSFQDRAIGLIEEWAELSKENQETLDKMNEAIDKQNQLEQMMNDLQNGEGSADSGDMQDLINDINNLNQQIGESNFPSYLEYDMKNIVSHINEEVKDAEKAFNDFGISKGGENGNTNKVIPFEQKKKLIETLKYSRNFKEVIDQLGRMKEMIGAISKKPTNHGQIISDIGVGNNISKVLSSEKVKLLDSDLEMQFYKKYADKELLEYKTQGIEESKGPIVVCLDISGSMDGRIEIWSKSVTVASLQLACMQKRNYRCIAFNSNIVKVWDVDKSSFIENVDTINEIASHGTYGGTNFEKPLEKALESVDESKYKKADILFITDGEPSGSLSEYFKNKLKSSKENKGFRIQSILVGSNNGSALKYLNEFSDNIITLNNLNKDNELVNIFNNMKQ